MFGLPDRRDTDVMISQECARDHLAGIRASFWALCFFGMVTACANIAPPAKSPNDTLTDLAKRLVKAQALADSIKGGTEQTDALTKVYSLGKELVAVVKQAPEKVDGQGIDTLITLLAPDHRWTSGYAADALATLGPRASRAVPVLKASLKETICTQRLGGEGRVSYFHELDALIAIEGKPVSAPTPAECGLAPRPAETEASNLHDVEMILASLAKYPMTEAEYALGRQLVAMLWRQDPAKVGDKEVHDLMAVSQWPESASSAAAAIALGILGRRALVAAPMIQATYQKIICMSPILLGQDSRGAFYWAYRQITSAVPGDLTQAECQKLLGTNDLYYWLPGHS